MCAPVIFSPGQSSGTPGGYGVTGRAQTRPSAAAGWTLPVCENHASRTLITRSAGIVAISLAVGVGFSAAPDALAALPFWASSLLSGVPGTAITAVVLSLILPEKKEEKAA